MRRRGDMITVRGVNDDMCIIQPQEYSWGPFLAPKSTGLFDMAIQTNWGIGPFGQFFQSWKPKRRDCVFTMHIMNPDTGREIDEDSDLWHTIYSRWRNMFSPDVEASVDYTSIDGTRTLGLRTLQAARSVSSQNFEGIDPHVFAYGSIVQTMAAELPFYVGPSQKYTHEWVGAGNFWAPMPYFNPGSVDIWPEWDVTGGARYVLPDYSFGSEAYGRGVNDIGKTFPVPLLLPGENTTVMSRPDMELFLSEWETPVGNRNPGFNLEYPIRPGRGSADAGGPNPGCVVRALNVTDGAAITLTLPRWYADPFSTPRIA